MQIIKEPTGIYPVYNNSFLVVKSEAERIEIKVFPEEKFKRIFYVFPSPNKKECQFNFKEIVKSFFEDGFFDDGFFEDGLYKTIKGNYLVLNLIITEVFNNNSRIEYLKRYRFFRCVRQIGDSLEENTNKILTYSKNNKDFYITYFEGFPFSIDIMRVFENQIVKLNNLKNGLEVEFNVNETGTFRINLDNSNNRNISNSTRMPIELGVNKLQLLVDKEVKSNVFINKKKKCKGVYLKWYNNEGGYSYFLFNEFYKEKLQSKEIEIINNNSKFNNIGELNNEVRSIGKNARTNINVKAKCDIKEMELLKSLFTSPLVEVYSSFEANKKGKFINVLIKKDFEFYSKKAFNDVSIIIEMPKIKTITL